MPKTLKTALVKAGWSAPMIDREKLIDDGVIVPGEVYVSAVPPSTGPVVRLDALAKRKAAAEIAMHAERRARRGAP